MNKHTESYINRTRMVLVECEARLASLIKQADTLTGYEATVHGYLIKDAKREINGLKREVKALERTA